MQSEAGMGLFLHTEKIYHNFILELSLGRYITEADNSGVFVSFPYRDNGPMIAVNNGYEIQIDDLAMPDGNPIHQTGAIYGFPPTFKADCFKRGRSMECILIFT